MSHPTRTRKSVNQYSSKWELLNRAGPEPHFRTMSWISSDGGGCRGQAISREHLKQEGIDALSSILDFEVSAMEGDRHGMRSVVCFQFFQDVPHVALNGVFGDI
jgi:hypothetical protein